jgi:1-deoxy-D-xylulose-5-phosphate reductoisomerase
MSDETRRLVILGSTGSIGRQTLEVVRALPEHFKIIGLAGGENTALILEQINEFAPSCYYSSSEKELDAGDCKYMPLEDMAGHPDADIVVIATSGTAGLNAVLAAVRAGKTIALANKESLVAAGEIVIDELKKYRARILPVDSEHSAIWQCLKGENQRPRRIILTASGGPFREYSREQMEAVTVEQALQHPSWQMGKKVTIDSATLMNKGLEVIEAHWLFDVPIDDIRVLVHPGSLIHSMVEFDDGSVKAQMGCPDMRLPIQYALTFPDRFVNPGLPSIDWDSITGLQFEPPDTDRFPCLRLAIEAGKEGGTSPAVLCAADEAAVELFLSGRIRFTDISLFVGQILERHVSVHHPALEEITAAETLARDTVIRLAGVGA